MKIEKVVNQISLSIYFIDLRKNIEKQESVVNKLLSA